MLALMSLEFILWYVLLVTVLLILAKTYLTENIQPHFLLVAFAVFLGYMTITTFPKPPADGDLMLDMGIFVAIAALPVVLAGLLITRLVADFMVGSGDFDSGKEAGFLNDVKMPLDNFISSGHFYDGIDFLRSLQVKGKYKRDYRVEMEIAAIAMTNIKDFPMALNSYKKVLNLTAKPEVVSFCLYRIADIYSFEAKTKPEAKKYLNQLLTRFPKTEFGKSAEIRLRLMEQGETLPENDDSVFKNVSISASEEPVKPLFDDSSSEDNKLKEMLSNLSDTSTGDAYQVLLKRSINKAKPAKAPDASEKQRPISPFASRQERFRANISETEQTPPSPLFNVRHKHDSNFSDDGG